MSPMQAFYERLSQAVESNSAYLATLAQLAQADLNRIAAFQSALGWEVWMAESV